MNQVQTHSVEIGGKTLTFETGRMAHQAHGACLITHGDTAILATATMSENPREGIDFFPLVVDFEPKFYATGKIKGSRFIKREGRAPESAILTSRMIDRPLRPLFPKGMRNDVQIIGTLLQTDGLRSTSPTAINAASMAVVLSGIPFEAPVGAVRMGMKDDGSLFFDPTYEETEKGDLDLVIAGTEETVLMIEAGANLISNEKMLEAMSMAHEEIKKICKAQKEFAAKHTIEIKEIQKFLPAAEAEVAVDAVLSDADFDAVSGVMKHEIKDKLHALEDRVLEANAERIENEELKKGDLLEFVGKKFAKGVEYG